jgi:hypothetical protein
VSQTRRPLVCLFVGPSASAEEMLAALGPVDAEIELLPPIQQGDVLRLLARSPDALGIVDGVFFHVPAVMHREILLALEGGVRVFGASSIGALRAAELDRFGMVGVGRIYDLYQRGRIEGDDEVAVLHAEADLGYRPVTEALVNVRENLRRARRHGIVSAGTASVVLASARRLYFGERTYHAILTEARGTAPEDELVALDRFLRREAVDLKRADALALARTLGRHLGGAVPWPRRVPVQVVRTTHFDRYCDEYVGRAVDGLHVPDALVVAFQRLLAATLPALDRRVALRCLAVDEAIERGLTREGSEVLLERFRRANDLEDEATFADWLDERCLLPDELALVLGDHDLEARLLATYTPRRPDAGDEAALLDLVRQDVARRVGVRPEDVLVPLRMRPGVPWSRPLTRELKLHGEFGPGLLLAGRILQQNAAFFEAHPDLRLSRLRRGLVDEHAARRWGVPRSGLEAAIEDRGFAGYGPFFEPAARLFLYERAQQGAAGGDPRDWFQADA